MSFLFVVRQIVIVSLPIILGWAANKLGYMGGKFDGQLSRVLLNIAFPCMILGSLGSSGELPSPGDTVLALVGSTLSFFIAWSLGAVIARLLRAPNDHRGAYEFGVTFSNCGLIGFPVISAVFGEQALVIAAIFLIPLNVGVFTAGLLMFTSEGGSLQKQMRQFIACCKSPALIACVIVLICALLRIENLGLLSDSLRLIGKLTSPTALLLTGSSLASYQVRAMFDNWRAYVAAIGRLFIVPIITLTALRLLPISRDTLAVLVLAGAMPVGTNGILYSLQYEKDVRPIAQTTFLSIIFAIISIPTVTLLAV